MKILKYPTPLDPNYACKVEFCTHCQYVSEAHILAVLTHLSLASFFVGHRQTVQTQIRRRRTQRLIRVCTVCLQKVLLEF